MSAAPAAKTRIAVLCAAWIAAAAAIIPVQNRIDAAGKESSVVADQLYFASPRILKLLSFGYESVVADAYWMRAIQYYGRRDEADRRPVRYKNLAALLDITTTLDPQLIDAYRSGSSFLAEPDPVGAGQPEEALKLLDKGIGVHPGDWRLYYDKGFVYFWFLKDYKSAGETWLVGSQQPNAPPFMQGLSASALTRGGAVETARALWQRQLRESERADLKANARNHLDSIQVNEDLWTLEFLIERFRSAAGRPPSDYQELLRAGLIRALPLDPSGVPYFYDSETATPQLSIQSKVRYLDVPYDYRDAFMEKLREQVSGLRSRVSDRRNPTGTAPPQH
jgi:hypothetical protein